VANLKAYYYSFFFRERRGESSFGRSRCRW